MEQIYWVLVGVLVLLAVSDLVVGVSNDAVNFLNSSFGAKAASFKMIMLVASVGIILGATFSSGMMEVARKGIFHPQHFYFSEIIIIFLAVMITDVILLDVFNTFSMPTSTTVSIVFELLGAAVGVSAIKLATTEQIITLDNGMERVARMSDYINSEKALVIISGILLSVVIAFTVGAIIQYFSRLLFSFRYHQRLKIWGPVWGGIAITAITYFILIKGLKGSAYAGYEITEGVVLKDWVMQQALPILGVSLIIWTVILAILRFLFKLDILKTIVLVGTFALAMAFAGNDLVNFIGVPLAGVESMKVFIASGGDPDTFLMTSMSGQVKTPVIFLIIAGIIMVITLVSSKKSLSVLKTSINLGRQSEGYERFGSTGLSRVIVRGVSNMTIGFRKIIPLSIQNVIDKQFDQTYFIEEQKRLGKEAPAFDMIRASVTLVVASILISFATSLKLPLSTTYVTFMVAMGTSLADRAWGQESAVYRITGVLSVIGGWFFTAFSAFTAAFILAIIFSYLGYIAIFVFVLIAAFVVYRTHFVHKKRMSKVAAMTEEEEEDDEKLNTEKVVQKAGNRIVKTLVKITTTLEESLKYFRDQNLKQLRQVNEDYDNLYIKIKSYKDNINKIIKKLEEGEVESGHYYVQVIDALREISKGMYQIVQPTYEHINNSHKPLIDVQHEELAELKNELIKLINLVLLIIEHRNMTNVNAVITDQEDYLELVRKIRKNQVKRIKANEVGTRNSIVFFGLIDEYKNISVNLIRLIKFYRDFIYYLDGKLDEDETY